MAVLALGADVTTRSERWAAAVKVVGLDSAGGPGWNTKPRLQLVFEFIAVTLSVPGNSSAPRYQIYTAPYITVVTAQLLNANTASAS